MSNQARLDELLDAVRRRFPDRTAVAGRDGSLSYAQLWERSGTLAARLRAAGLGTGTGDGDGAGDLAALIAGPGLDLIVAMVAVARAGAGYVVLDPAYPEARRRYLLEDSRPAVVVAVPGETGLPEQLGLPVVVLDGALDVSVGDVGGIGGVGDVSDVDGIGSVGDAGDVAYVIYTSGTTGAPKGVVVEHRQVGRLFEATRPWFGFDERDVWTLFHSASFDFSVWEIWGALLHGGCLVIVPVAARRHPGALLDILNQHQVTVLNQTPSAFRQLLLAEESDPDRIPTSLRTIVFGGERLDVDLVAGFRRRHPTIELINMYGITETTVHVTYRRLTLADLMDPAVSPIGEPIPDLTVTIRDAEGQPVADGEPGRCGSAAPEWPAVISTGRS